MELNDIIILNFKKQEYFIIFTSNTYSVNSVIPAKAGINKIIVIN
jgi:hypothetical protein